MMRGLILALAFLTASASYALDIGVHTPVGDVGVHTGSGNVGIGVHTPAGNVGVHVGTTTPPGATPPPGTTPPPVTPLPADDDPIGRIRDMLSNFTPEEFAKFKINCVVILKNEAAFPDEYVTMCKIALEIMKEPK